MGSYPNKNEYNNNNQKLNNTQVIKNNSLLSTIEVQELYDNFMKANHMINSFYDIETEDDPTFNKLKEEERNILIDYLDKNKSNFIKLFKAKLNNAFIPKDSIKELVSEFIEQEDGEGAFQYKIEECIKKIEKTREEFEIKYLTVMVVGKSGVGKSTLINEVLRLEGSEKAKVGTGNFVTTVCKEYKSEYLEFLKLIDTRGIELNSNYGAEQVQEDASNHIESRKETNDPNKFVSCIWYCITGTRFEEAEKKLLNSLRTAYGDSKIPIILIYTKANDNKAINEMKEYIKEIKLDANFIPVLAQRLELPNNCGVLEPFGIDQLIKETLNKCKKALNGEMFSVITKSISKKVLDILKIQNDLDKEYIIRMMKLSFINNFRTCPDKNIFLQFIIHLLGFNIKIFFEKKEKKVNEKCHDIFLHSYLFSNFIDVMIDEYNNIASNFVEQMLDKKAREFIDLQVDIQKKCKKEISFQNQRKINDFRENIKDFLCGNYHFLAQKLIIDYIFRNIFEKITDEFVNKFNNITMQILEKEKNIDLIKECFMLKFNDFENRLKSYQNLLSRPPKKYKNSINIYKTTNNILTNDNNNNDYHQNNNINNNNFYENDKLKLNANNA